MPDTALPGFTHPHAQRLAAFWTHLRLTVTLEQKDQVGLAYLSHVLAFGDDVAERLTREADLEIQHQVGRRQGGWQSDPYTPDLKAFWERVREIFPGTYSQEDISFLVEKGGLEGVFEFLWQLEPWPLDPDLHRSSVLWKLMLNALAYK